MTTGETFGSLVSQTTVYQERYEKQNGWNGKQWGFNLRSQTQTKKHKRYKNTIRQVGNTWIWEHSAWETRATLPHLLFAIGNAHTSVVMVNTKCSRTTKQAVRKLLQCLVGRVEARKCAVNNSQSVGRKTLVAKSKKCKKLKCNI